MNFSCYWELPPEQDRLEEQHQPGDGGEDPPGPAVQAAAPSDHVHTEIRQQHDTCGIRRPLTDHPNKFIHFLGIFNESPRDGVPSCDIFFTQ